LKGTTTITTFRTVTFDTKGATLKWISGNKGKLTRLLGLVPNAPQVNLGNPELSGYPQLKKLLDRI
jgi:hypothetical protein